MSPRYVDDSLDRYVCIFDVVVERFWVRSLGEEEMKIRTKTAVREEGERVVGF